MIHLPYTSAVLISLMLIAVPSFAGPVVEPTAEGQIGEMPGVGDQVLGSRFESIRGQVGDVIFGGIFVFGGVTPPPPEAQFLTDSIHGTPNPVQVTATSSLFANIDKLVPDSSWSRNAADDGDYVAFSFAVDGTMPQTLTVRIATFDENGDAMVEVPLIEDVETFMFPDPTFAKTGAGVDDQGRVTVTYTDFNGGLPQVRATRINAVSGTVIDPDFPITDIGHGNPDVALLDPAGNRLIVTTTDLVNPFTVRGNIVDFSGPTPAILPEFPINDTGAAFGDFNAVVAADRATGVFTAAWDHITGVVGDPADVRARRFDAMGNPIGGDFLVNTTTANAQGQPAVAYGPASLSAIVWAGDATMPQGQDDLDVFLQVYDPMGNPIGGEVKVNTFDMNTQDRPAVRFLPDRDAQGRPQVAVVWRDAGNAAGFDPRGTGISYRCFSINGFEEQVPIFEDGFESGDTSSWSSTICGTPSLFSPTSSATKSPTWNSPMRPQWRACAR